MKIQRTLISILLFASLLPFTSWAGMRMTLYMVNADKVAVVQKNKMIETFLSQTNGARVLNIDKAWSGIDFLLNGTNKPVGSPKSSVIFGGKPVGEDLGYGPARLLTPSEVKAIATALKDETAQTLSLRFEPATMQKIGIYPEEIWLRDRKESLDYLIKYYEKLKVFYENAAMSGSGVLLAIE